MTIGERIKERREALGMTQQELADRLGYKSRSSINKIEMNGRNLTQSKIKAIADVLQTTPGYIMGWSEEIKHISVQYSNEYHDLLKEIYDFVGKADEKSLEELKDYLEFLITKLKKEDNKL